MRSTSADEKKLRKYMTLTLVQEKIQTHLWLIWDLIGWEVFIYFLSQFSVNFSLIIKRAEKNEIKNVFYLLYAF